MNLDMLDIEPATLRAMRRALEEVQTRLDDCGPYALPLGICGESGSLHLGFRHELHAIMATWPEYSGSEEYPVCHPDVPRSRGRTTERVREAAFEAYDFGGFHFPKWTGKYGAARRRLLAWCIYACQYLESKEV